MRCEGVLKCLVMPPTLNPDLVVAGASIVTLTNPAASANSIVNFDRLAAWFTKDPVASPRVPHSAELAV